MLILLLALVLIGVVVAGVLGLGPLASERPTPRGGVLGGAEAPLALVAGGLILVVALAVGFFGVFGVPGRSGDPEPRLPSETILPSEPTTTSPSAAPTTVAREAPPPTGADEGVDDRVDGGARRPTDGVETVADEPRRRAGGAALGPVVSLAAEDEEEDADRFPRSYDVIDALESDTVLRARVGGFEPFTQARARQCVSAVVTSCGNAIDVQFSAEGTASFQYLVTDDFVIAARTSRCRAGAAPCSLVVESTGGEQRAAGQTVFHDRVPPPGRITVRPARDLVDGRRVTVEVENYPPGAQVQAMMCAPPDATGSGRCGAPGPTAPLTVGPDGRGSTKLTIRAGPVGRERAPCDRSRLCGVSVASETVFARAPVVPVAFAAPPGADYDPARLGTGLAVAAVLLALVTWLVRRTDWSPVGEGAAPEIDAAEYADLDAIVATLPPAETLDDLLERTR